MEKAQQLFAEVIAFGVLGFAFVSGWLGNVIADADQRVSFTLGDGVVTGGLGVIVVYLALCFIVVVAFVNTLRGE